MKMWEILKARRSSNTKRSLTWVLFGLNGL